MSSARIFYTPHPDATPESEASALASAYRYLLNRYAKNEATHYGGPDDVNERPKNDSRAKSIIPN